jgi:hypothetical protein
MYLKGNIGRLENSTHNYEEAQKYFEESKAPKATIKASLDLCI